MQVERLAGPNCLLAIKRAWPERYPGLLESLARGAAPARYDLLFAGTGEALVKDAEGELRGPPGLDLEGGFLTSLRRWQRRIGRTPFEPELPFAGGWLLFLGYELAGEIEARLQLPEAALPWPQALALRTPVVALYDHLEQQLLLVSETGHEALAAQVRDDLLNPPADAPVTPSPLWSMTEETPARFLAGVDRILDYLRAGDSFQINLSRGWTAQANQAVDPHALYQRLRQSNPAPFAGMLSWAGSHLLSSSPERLVEIRGRLVQTRPIAGTRARHGLAEEELNLPRDPKERAEHIMLIDLERNDLGRVCEPGTIEVNELLAVESYAHVHHIVSNVRGVLRKTVDAVEVISATFPGGTITGCPKFRSMQIIAELEGQGRGPYTGALGFLGRGGELDLNILIRSMLLHEHQVWLRTGAGIVIDSVPQRELEETRAKAEGLLRALR